MASSSRVRRHGSSRLRTHVRGGRVWVLVISTSQCRRGAYRCRRRERRRSHIGRDRMTVVSTSERPARTDSIGGRSTQVRGRGRSRRQVTVIGASKGGGAAL